jgi:hypothetical protein
MTPRRLAVPAAISLIFAAAVAFSLAWGPSRRRAVEPPRVVAVGSSAALGESWRASGAHGRVAVLFTRYLNAVASREDKDTTATEAAVEQAILRRVHHVPPDRAWPEIDGTLSRREDMRKVPGGYLWMSLDVRIQIAPLSRFEPVGEPALVVVEPAVWSPEELRAIAGRIRAGDLETDLLVVIRGSEADTELFRSALADAPRRRRPGA